MVSTSARDVVERQRVAERAEQQHGADDAEQMPAAAEDRDAAEQHDGDDGQLEADRVVRPRRGEAEGVDDAGQRGDHAGDDEEPELDALHAHAGEVRGLFVGAHREDRAPDARAVQDDAEDHGQHDERGSNGFGIWVPANVPKPQSVNCDGKSATAWSPRITYARPRYSAERADRHGERRQPQACDQHAVERSRQRAGDQDRRDDHLHRPSRGSTGSPSGRSVRPTTEATERSISAAMMIKRQRERDDRDLRRCRRGSS